MALIADLRILYHLALHPVGGATHAERLENFYRGQATDYDAFRQRLLPGRSALMNQIEVPPGGTWVDLGGGTGSNLEYLGDRLHTLQRVFIVDLSRSLLDVARERSQQRGWHNVTCVETDATTFMPSAPVDVVTCSYSLSMIPDWFAALRQAVRILRPGGTIGVVDFYISRKYPAPGHCRHNWLTRTFWPAWFACDNVFLNADLVPYLHREFTPQHFAEGNTSIPYLPLAKVPFFTFVGRRA